MQWSLAASKHTMPGAHEHSTRERVLDTAELLFAERGYAATAMRDIATRAGLKAPSLYNHFPSKQALYAAVLERGLLPLYGLVDQLARSDWTSEHLDEIADALVQRLTARPQVPRLLLQGTLAGGEQLEQLVRKWLRPLYERALETFRVRRSPGLRVWSEQDLPFLIMGFHHLISSHFALLPLAEQIFQADPLSDMMVQRYRGFIREVVGLLLLAQAPAGVEPRVQEPGPSPAPPLA